jgi:hypothetical protein
VGSGAIVTARRNERKPLPGLGDARRAIAAAGGLVRYGVVAGDVLERMSVGGKDGTPAGMERVGGGQYQSHVVAIYLPAGVRPGAAIEKAIDVVLLDWMDKERGW